MKYAMSDIHGEYEKYAAMLKRIRFSPEDELYVLGDAVDRGPEPMKLLQDMASRDNVFPILGNHEATALALLRRLTVEITADNWDTQLDATWMARLTEWQLDGGASTIRAFRALRPEQRADILDYMEDFPLYEAVDAGDRTFVLVHAALGNFDERRPLRDYRPEEVLLGRLDFDRRYFSDPAVSVVAGHTPTQALTGRAEILRRNGSFDIDCGACFPGGRLACLCLDTLEEFYE